MVGFNVSGENDEFLERYSSCAHMQFTNSLVTSLLDVIALQHFFNGHPAHFCQVMPLKLLPKLF